MEKHETLDHEAQSVEVEGRWRTLLLAHYLLPRTTPGSSLCSKAAPLLPRFLGEWHIHLTIPYPGHALISLFNLHDQTFKVGTGMVPILQAGT